MGLVHQPLVRESATVEPASRSRAAFQGRKLYVPNEPEFLLTMGEGGRYTQSQKADRLAESLVYNILCLLHIIHIAGEKSYLLGSWEV